MPKRMNSSEAINFFEDLKKNKDLHLEMPQVGCFARTDIICKLLEEKGFEAKIVRTNTPSAVKGKVFFKGKGEQKVSNREVNWNFHVAAAVDVEGQILVLDPAMLSGPETVSRWASSMTLNGTPLQEETVLVEDYKGKGEAFVSSAYKSVSSENDKAFFAKTKNEYEGHNFISKPSVWLGAKISNAKYAYAR
ncbi:MAG: protein-glutamine glutaminase family protein [Alphaproteobacteria bacterium]